MAKRRTKKKKGRRGASAKTSTKVDVHPVVVKLGPVLGEGVKRVVQKHSKGGRFSLSALPDDDRQVKLTEVDVGEFTYVLSRIKRLPEDSLTDRQRQIAIYVANGMSNKDIAEKLGISAATVAAHLRTIFTKLRLKSRTALAKYALGFC